jgi:hypothetical protein
MSDHEANENAAIIEKKLKQNIPTVDAKRKLIEIEMERAAEPRGLLAKAEYFLKFKQHYR